MSPLGGAVTLDVDGKGKVWASAPDGAVRFDPETERFTDFKSLSYKTARGTGMTYGAAGDRDGNGWWTQMAFDIVGKGDVATGKTLEVKLPAVKSELDRATPEARAFYDKFDDLSFNSPLPWQQGPRRMGTDKNADVLWVGNSWGGTLSRIDTKTLEATLVPLPDPTAMQPYHLVVDKNHNVWGNLWTNDQILKYDPGSSKWTIFELPVRGTEIRHISLDERNGVTQVILPVYRTNQMGVMTLRSDADLAALKAQAGGKGVTAPSTAPCEIGGGRADAPKGARSARRFEAGRFAPSKHARRRKFTLVPSRQIGPHDPRVGGVRCALAGLQRDRRRRNETGLLHHAGSPDAPELGRDAEGGPRGHHPRRQARLLRCLHG